MIKSTLPTKRKLFANACGLNPGGPCIRYESTAYRQTTSRLANVALRRQSQRECQAQLADLCDAMPDLVFPWPKTTPLERAKFLVAYLALHCEQYRMDDEQEAALYDC